MAIDKNRTTAGTNMEILHEQLQLQHPLKRMEEECTARVRETRVHGAHGVRNL